MLGVSTYPSLPNHRPTGAAASTAAPVGSSGKKFQSNQMGWLDDLIFLVTRKVNQGRLKVLSYSLDVSGTCIPLNSEEYFVQHDLFGSGI